MARTDRSQRPGPGIDLGGRKPVAAGPKLLLATAFLIALWALAMLTDVGRRGYATAYYFMSFFAGVFTLIGLTLTVMIGLLATYRVIIHPRQRVWIQSAHRTLGILSVIFLVFHIFTKIGDGRITPTGVAIPFLGGVGFGQSVLYVGLGPLAGYMMFGVLWTGLVRRRFVGTGRPWMWRALHCVAYLSWPIALVHGLGAGRAPATWVTLSYLACVVIVAIGLLFRLSVGRGRRTQSGRLATTTMATGGVAMRPVGKLAPAVARRIAEEAEEPQRAAGRELEPAYADTMFLAERIDRPQRRPGRELEPASARRSAGGRPRDFAPPVDPTVIDSTWRDLAEEPAEPRGRRVVVDDEPPPVRRRRDDDGEEAVRPRRRAIAHEPRRAADDDQDEDAAPRVPRRRADLVEEDEPPRARRRRAAEDEDLRPRRRRADPVGDEDGDEFEDETPRARRRRAADEEEPRAGRRRAADTEDETPRARRRRAADTDDEEEPRARRRRAADDEDEDRPRRRRAADRLDDGEDGVTPPPPRRPRSADEYLVADTPRRDQREDLYAAGAAAYGPPPERPGRVREPEPGYEPAPAYEPRRAYDPQPRRRALAGPDTEPRYRATAPAPPYIPSPSLPADDLILDDELVPPDDTPTLVDLASRRAIREAVRDRDIDPLGEREVAREAATKARRSRRRKAKEQDDVDEEYWGFLRGEAQ